MFAVPPNTVLGQPLRTAAHPARLALEIARDRRRWAHLLRYDPDRRHMVLVEADADTETWLCAWLPGQHTDLHDHDGAAGAFTVVSGVLTEIVPRTGRRVVHTLTAGQSRAFGPGYAHQVRNAGADPAVSIHVYRPHRGNRTVSAPGW
jgi:predicted metal-dependent enzyme (double-stranded beta helix superfamily)